MFKAPEGNKFAMGYGRPAKYETAEEIITAIESYFIWIQGEYVTRTGTRTEKQRNEETGKNETVEVSYQYEECVRSPERPTITGLALHLGFESKQSMYDYEKKESFSYPIKRARLIIENAYEQSLHHDKPTGAIFALKNMGWVDRIEQDITNRNIDLTDELDNEGQRNEG